MSHEIRLPKVAPVIPDTITVELTKKHIHLGARCHQAECPFALAFNAAGFGAVRVGASEVVVQIDGKQYYYEIPENVSYMIIKFDIGRSVDMHPGTYTFKRINQSRLMAFC